MKLPEDLGFMLVEDDDPDLIAAIVRDCAAVCKKLSVEQVNHDNPLLNAHNGGLVRGGKAILHRYGLEEKK